MFKKIPITLLITLLLCNQITFTATSQTSFVKSNWSSKAFKHTARGLKRGLRDSAILVGGYYCGVYSAKLFNLLRKIPTSNKLLKKSLKTFAKAGTLFSYYLVFTMTLHILIPLQTRDYDNLTMQEQKEAKEFEDFSKLGLTIGSIPIFALLLYKF